MLVYVRWGVVLMIMNAACGSDERAQTRRVIEPKPQTPPAHTVNERVAAIGSTSHLSPELQRAFDPADDFSPMPKPGPSDWLAQHPEKPQSFDDFLNQDTRIPVAPRTAIYLLPIGEFPSSAPPLPALTKIVRAFFDLEVRVLPAVKVADVAVKTRINTSTNQRQL